MNSIYQEIGSEEIKTGSRTKNWNEAKWIEFIEELIKRDRAEQLTIPSVSGMFISTDYLMGLHPELNRKEAESLKEYANSNTIRYRECYGDGSIIYPRWKVADKQEQNFKLRTILIENHKL